MATIVENERAVLSIREVAVVLGIGQAAVYRAATAGDIPTLRIGGRILVPRAALFDMLGLKAKEPTKE